MAVRAKPKYQTGFSLIEIMIALTIGLVLTAGIIQIFQGTKASYRTNEGLSRVQESGRFAMDLFSREIRMAGYQGCRAGDELQPNIEAEATPAEVAEFVDNRIIEGDDNVAGGVTVGGRAVAAGTDTLEVRRASTSAAPLTGNMSADNANIQILGNGPGLGQNDLAFITDCGEADIFRITNTPNTSGTVTLAHSSSGNKDNRLSKAYKTDALVMGFVSGTYFVADSGVDNEAGQDILSLYIDAPGAAPEELIRGVENMQVQYGEDTSGDGSVDAYVSASAVTDFENVIAVRVALLVNSVEAALSQDDTSTYTLLDQVVDPADDRLMRKVFTVTAAIRNRELRSNAFN